MESGEAAQALFHRMALRDLVEGRAISLLEGDEFEGRRAGGALNDKPCEVEDADLALVADIDRLAGRGGISGQQLDGRHRVAHIAERTRLRAVAEDSERLAGQGLLDEAREDESVIAGLTRPDCVEEPRHSHLQAVLLAVGHGLDFVGQLAQRVTGEPALARQIDQLVVLAEIAAVRMAVDRRTRGDDHLRVTRGGGDGGQQALGGADVHLGHSDRFAQHAEHADHGGEVVDAVGHVHRAGQAVPCHDVRLDEAETGIGTEDLDVGRTARAQVVDHHHFIAAVQVVLDHM